MGQTSPYAVLHSTNGAAWSYDLRFLDPLQVGEISHAHVADIASRLLFFLRLARDKEGPLLAGFGQVVAVSLPVLDRKGCHRHSVRCCFLEKVGGARTEIKWAWSFIHVFLSERRGQKKVRAMIRRRTKRERGDCAFIDRRGSLATHTEHPVRRKRDKDEEEEEERLEALVFGGQPFAIASHSDEESETPRVEEASVREASGKEGEDVTHILPHRVIVTVVPRSANQPGWTRMTLN